MTDYSDFSSSQLHEHKQAMCDIINERRQELQHMKRVRATEDIRIISDHLQVLYRDIEKINKELTRRRVERDASRARKVRTKRGERVAEYLTVGQAGVQHQGAATAAHGTDSL